MNRTMIMNGELARILKEASVTYFKNSQGDC